MADIEQQYPYVEESNNGQENFHSDEEPENSESQKEDMKIYLSKLNKLPDSIYLYHSTINLSSKHKSKALVIGLH